MKGFLRLASKLYQSLLNFDRRRTLALQLPRAVISVGNIASGGRGKTPFVIYLARGLYAKGFLPVVLTRGYGRNKIAAHWLENLDRNFSVKDSGDEALEIFMSTATPVLVGSNRKKNALRFLAERGAELEKTTSRRIVFILDDGFQHWSLRRDFDLVLTDAQDYVDFLLPRGRLRESVEALARAHLVLERGRDFEKKSELKVRPQPNQQVGVLTTRAPDPQYFQFFRAQYPHCERIELRDHAPSASLVRALKRARSRLILVGAKEAAKLLPSTELKNLFTRGYAPLVLHGVKYELRLVECRLQIFNETVFWDKIENAVRRSS